MGTDPVEPAEVTLGIDQSTVTAETLQGATVSSNYSISHVTVRAVDDKGEVLYRYVKKFVPSDTGGNAIICTSLSMEKAVIPATLNRFANKDGVTIQVLCRVSNGEEPVIWEGKLTK